MPLEDESPDARTDIGGSIFEAQTGFPQLVQLPAGNILHGLGSEKSDRFRLIYKRDHDQKATF
jgi:hypothetical protein